MHARSNLFLGMPEFRHYAKCHYKPAVGFHRISNAETCCFLTGTVTSLQTCMEHGIDDLIYIREGDLANQRAGT